MKFPPKRLLRLLIDRQFKLHTAIKDQYIVLDILGFGSYGTIYLCQDAIRNQQVVLKQMTKSKKKKTIHEMYNKEVQILSELNHPHIPRFIDFFTFQHNDFIVMEHIKGVDFENLLFEQNYRFNERNSLMLIKELVSIVSFVHSQGVSHGDIRLPNVIYQNQKIILMDFGLASRFPHTSDCKQNPAKDDFYDIGDFLLFLLYSDYDTAGKRNSMWTDELSVCPPTAHLLKRLLGIGAAYSTTQEIIADINKAIECCDS